MKSLKNTTIAGACSIAIAIGATPASAAMIDLTGVSLPTDGSPLTIAIGGETLTIEGGTINDDGTGATIVGGSVVKTRDGGLGVFRGTDSPLVETEGDDQNEFLQLTFSTNVLLKDFVVGFADRLDDVSVIGDGAFLFRVGTKTAVDMSQSIDVSQRGRIFLIAAGLTGEDNTTARDGTRNDEFSLQSIDASVPVPAAGLLFGTAALAGGVARVKRRRA